MNEEEVTVQSIKTFEERIEELEDKINKIDEALGAVVAFVREHNHDSLGNSYVPQKL